MAGALRGLIDAAPLGIACLLPDGRLLYANRAYRAVVYGDEGAPELFGRIAGAASGLARAGEQVIELEVVEAPTAVLDRGRAHLVRVFGLPGRRPPLVGVLVGDARDRVSLRAGEQRFRAFMDNGPALTVIMDRDDQPVFMGRPALQMLGIDLDDLSRPADELVDPGFLEAFRPMLARVRDTGQLQSSVVSFPLPDGRVRDMQVYYFPLPGEPEGMVGGISLDVTETRAAQRQLADAAEEEAALRRLATVVAAEADDEEVFGVVTREVGRLLRAQTTNMVRFGTGSEAVVLGAWNQTGAASVPVGTTVMMDGDTVLTRVFRTAAPARIDSYDDIPGELAARLRGLGLRSSVAAPILLQGRLWGAFTASTTEPDPMPPGSEERIAHFAELVTQALANNEARSELAASRERIVEAADHARRGLARDLHDGAQQRLVALMITMRATRRRLEGAPQDALEKVDDAIDQLSLAVEELRELAHGIHPAILTDHGLPAALRAMAAKSLVPIDVHCELPNRLPAPLEAALYFVCSESLANMHKHADAPSATIRVSTDDTQVHLSINDSGRGGAAVRPGGGLQGLEDRVQALGGTFAVHSPPGNGTHTRVSLRLTQRD
jgi:PAS domain S-box-containing protein